MADVSENRDSMLNMSMGEDEDCGLEGYEDINDVIAPTGNTETEDGHKCIKCEESIKESEEYVKCTFVGNVNEQIENLTIDPSATAHRLCARCVPKVAEYDTEHTEHIAGNGIGFACVAPGCNNVFRLSELHHLIPPELDEPVHATVAHISVDAYCAENPHEKFTFCCKCGCRAVVPDSVRFFACQHCKYYQCLFCFRPATKAHDIRSCDDMDRAERHPSRRFEYYNTWLLKPPVY